MRGPGGGRERVGGELACCRRIQGGAGSPVGGAEGFGPKEGRPAEGVEGVEGGGWKQGDRHTRSDRRCILTSQPTPESRAWLRDEEGEARWNWVTFL